MENGLIMQIVTTVAGFVVFGGTLVWRVAAMFSERDLELAKHVRERDAAIQAVRSELAAFREQCLRDFASKESIAAWMRELKADMDRRFDRLDEKIDAMRAPHGHD